jgi:hypothetical protein
MPWSGGPAEVSLKWASTAGKTYNILWSSNLTAGFEVLATGWTATGSASELHI